MTNFVRDASIWKDGKPWVRDGGIWKEVKTGFVRDSGVWKEFYSSGPTIGQPWEGGYYIGDNIADGVLYHIIVAPKMLGQMAGARWKDVAVATPGTYSTTDGIHNLMGIVADGIQQHPAESFCRNLIIGGYTDWYLPAESELELFYTNRDSIQGDDSFDKSVFYWSSTSGSGTNARCRRLINLNDFTQRSYISTANTTRAIRRVAA